MDPFGSQRLILGGHSFITALGSDAAATPGAQREIVAACLRGGITTFDTTYAPERVAWGRAIADQEDATQSAIPIVWNFFGHPAAGDDLPGPKAWSDSGIETALRELGGWRGRVALVLHPVGDGNADQLAAAVRWKTEGRIAALGVWISFQCDPKHRLAVEQTWQWILDQGLAWDFVVTPKNLAVGPANDELLARAKTEGWTTLATSPFERGWDLDRRVAHCVEREGSDPLAARRRIAAALLRFSAFSPNVDHVVTAMRAASYVGENLSALAAGPLTPAELTWLKSLG